MTTRRDPWKNILRGTLACFAAGVGGADAIVAKPYAWRRLIEAADGLLEKGSGLR